jgi:biopolymer transport protein ExbD
MLKKNERRERAAIGTGSMADIAFLLLIFFLVATTIDTDKGIKVKLPAYVEEVPDCSFPIKERNLFSILVNANDELLVEGKNEELKNLKERTKEFILNPLGDANLSESPVNAIVALQNDRATTYEVYLGVYNELRAAYNEIWDEVANTRYRKNYEDLGFELQKKIRNDFPLIISESEPTDFAQR